MYILWDLNCDILKDDTKSLYELYQLSKVKDN